MVLRCLLLNKKYTVTRTLSSKVFPLFSWRKTGLLPLKTLVKLDYEEADGGAVMDDKVREGSKGRMRKRKGGKKMCVCVPVCLFVSECVCVVL